MHEEMVEELRKIRGAIHVMADRSSTASVDWLKEVEHRLTTLETNMSNVKETLATMNKVLIGLVSSTATWVIIQVLMMLSGRHG